MPNRSHFLVPVDHSDDLERVVELAVSMAIIEDGTVDMLYVDRDATLHAADLAYDEWRTRLASLRENAERRGVRSRVVILSGRPEQVIPAYAQMTSAGIIVVGRDYGTVRWWRNASVVRRMSRWSPVPVLVVPPVGARDQPGPFRVAHIVAPVDDRVASVVALRAAAELATRHAARLTILHAMEDEPGHMIFSGGEATRVARSLSRQTTVIAERLTRRAASCGASDVEVKVVTGVPHRAILHVASARRADLVVMGVAPRTGLDDVVFGSTLHAVLRNATTPVLVLPVVAGGYEWRDDTCTYGSGDALERELVVRRVAA